MTYGKDKEGNCIRLTKDEVKIFENGGCLKRILQSKYKTVVVTITTKVKKERKYNYG